MFSQPTEHRLNLDRRDRATPSNPTHSGSNPPILTDRCEAPDLIGPKRIVTERIPNPKPTQPCPAGSGVSHCHGPIRSSLQRKREIGWSVTTVMSMCGRVARRRSECRTIGREGDGRMPSPGGHAAPVSALFCCLLRSSQSAPCKPLILTPVWLPS